MGMLRELLADRKADPKPPEELQVGRPRVDEQPRDDRGRFRQTTARKVLTGPDEELY